MKPLRPFAVFEPPDLGAGAPVEVPGVLVMATDHEAAALCAAYPLSLVGNGAHAVLTVAGNGDTDAAPRRYFARGRDRTFRVQILGGPC